jgi:diaminopimelate epimerase
MPAPQHPLAHHAFYKMNGIGNEIIVLDVRANNINVSPADARAIARDPALSYDQLMVLEPPRSAGTAAFMRIYNNDGSLSASCGNGTRCVAWRLMQDQNLSHLTLETDAGLLECVRDDEWHYTVDMGTPRLNWDAIPLREAISDTNHVTLAQFPTLPAASCVNMGNPHAVFFLNPSDTSPAPDLASLGPHIEHDPLFPERVNVSFAYVRDPTHIKLDVWERAAGLTRACGSAACATLVAAVRRQLCARKATVHLPGGDLIIEWRQDQHVLMSGAVELERADHFNPDLFV